LLASLDATGLQRVESAVAEAAAGAFPANPETGAWRVEAGARIGAYEIERLLGAGGMGRVYLARRADADFRQQVAIKTLRAAEFGDQGEETIRRFRAERQILANLAHPGIARLLDGGVTKSGQPYLVMEYVDGLPVDEFCRRGALPLKERIQLFLRVCAAVHHAHQNLVVHRDIKPGNILVTGLGEPKLLDFGIAKLLEPSANVTQVSTRAFERLMTPEYASPEQARGEAITTASDVYALGVLLYELVTGRRPFNLQKDSGRGRTSDLPHRTRAPRGGRGSRQHHPHGDAQGAGAALSLRRGAGRGSQPVSQWTARAGAAGHHHLSLPQVCRTASPGRGIHRAGGLADPWFRHRDGDPRPAGFA
jgi:serine/threonine protein kinase